MSLGKILTLIAGLIIIFLLFSCGSAYHLRRAAYHVRKAEEKGATWKRDTVYQKIEVVRPEIRTDTVFQTKVGDTVVIEKDRLKVVYVRLPGDSVFIKGECKTDTVRIEVPTVVNNEIKAAPPKVKWWQWLLIGMGVSLILVFLMRFSR